MMVGLLIAVVLLQGIEEDTQRNDKIWEYFALVDLQPALGSGGKALLGNSSVYLVKCMIDLGKFGIGTSVWKANFLSTGDEGKFYLHDTLYLWDIWHEMCFNSFPIIISFREDTVNSFSLELEGFWNLHHKTHEVYSFNEENPWFWPREAHYSYIYGNSPTWYLSVKGKFKVFCCSFFSTDLYLGFERFNYPEAHLPDVYEGKVTVPTAINSFYLGLGIMIGYSKCATYRRSDDKNSDR